MKNALNTLLVTLWMLCSSSNAFQASIRRSHSFQKHMFLIQQQSSHRNRHNNNKDKLSLMQRQARESSSEVDEERERAQKLFWESQAKLASSIKGMNKEQEAEMKLEQKQKYEKRRLSLVSDTAYLGVGIFSMLWLLLENPFVAISFGLGTSLGTAYSYGLGKYVETLGGSADDAETVEGAGVGQARFAFLILLFVFVGKFKSQGLLEIPSIAGFFTYQVASLYQGLKEYND